jgi:hypothetical protein
VRSVGACKVADKLDKCKCQVSSVKPGKLSQVTPSEGVPGAGRERGHVESSQAKSSQVKSSEGGHAWKRSRTRMALFEMARAKRVTTSAHTHVNLRSAHHTRCCTHAVALEAPRADTRGMS